MTLAEYREKEAARVARNEKLLESGVEMADINTAYISEEAKIGRGTYIGPCVTIEGETVIGENCRIYQNTLLRNAVIGDRVEVESSVIKESSVGDDTKVGPFAYIRPGSVIGKGCKVGDFVEVKNSTLGDGTKSAHLTYIGDADLGRDINLGCGVVFVNYDGAHKFRSTVGDGAFIGCNSNIVSPVEIGEGAYVAAGSTVTKDVEKDALCVARTRQRNIQGWAKQRGLYRK